MGHTTQPKALRISCTATLLALIFSLAFSLPARAALGGDISSVQNDQAHMKGALRSTAAGNYVVHEITDSNGTVVREYASPGGKVFAVAWQGRWTPDLRQLFGTYFDQFAQAAQVKQSQRPDRGPLSIQEPGLTVHTSGSMRNVFGRAFIPEQMPEGLDPDSVR